VQFLKAFECLLAYLHQTLFSRVTSRQGQIALQSAIDVLNDNEGAAVVKVISIVLEDTVEMKLIIEDPGEV
jgi:hypothetical protein